MLDKLIDFLLELKNEIIPFKVVYEWEGGVHLRFGKYIKEIKPGLNFKIPFIDHIQRVFIVVQTVDLLPQTLTTKDGKTIVLKGIIRYKVSDCRKFIMSINSARDVLVDTVQGIIKQIVEDYTWGEDIELNDIITKKASEIVEVWGIKIELITLVDFAIIRTYRIISDHKL